MSNTDKIKKAFDSSIISKIDFKEPQRSAFHKKYAKQIPSTQDIMDFFNTAKLILNETRKERGWTGKRYGKLIKNTAISEEREGKRAEFDEVWWERLIVDNNKYLYNQLAVASPKESVDLIYSEDEDKKERQRLIELKTNLGTNNLLYAFLELLKYYFLIKETTKDKTDEHLDIKELIILAPKFYYKEHEKFGKFITNFCKLICDFNEEEEMPKVKLYYLNLTREEMRIPWDASDKIKENLKFEKWKMLETPEDIEKLELED